MTTRSLTFASAVESTQALLGALLCDPSARSRAAQVSPEHFAEPVHAAMLQFIDDSVARGQTPTLATIADAFAGNAAFEELGGMAWLLDLTDKAPPSTLIGEMADTVLTAFVKRKASERMSQGILDLAEQAGGDGLQAIETVRQDLERLVSQSSGGDGGAVTARQAGQAYLRDLDHARSRGGFLGLQTGLRCFDQRLGGLRPGHLLIVAGRPGMGKSGLARAAAFGCARLNPNHSQLIFSLEMRAESLAERGLADAWHSESPTGSLPYSQFVHADDHERVALGQMVEQLPINVILMDRSNQSLNDIRRAVWQSKSKGTVGAIFVDYLGLIERNQAYGARNEASQIGDITRGLAQLAKSANCCVVLLSQLNRDSEKREDERPQLSDLRDSGAIEQDAHAALLVYRKAYYLERSEPTGVGSAAHRKWQTDLMACRHEMEVHCAKNRSGAVGIDLQLYRPEYDQVADPTPQRWP